MEQQAQPRPRSGARPRRTRERKHPRGSSGPRNTTEDTGGINGIDEIDPDWTTGQPTEGSNEVGG